MKKFMKSHKIVTGILIFFLFVLLIIGGFSIKSAIDTHQATQKIESALKDNGYTNIVRRNKTLKSRQGPFSNYVWYEYTFANKETLEASRKYLKHKNKDYKNLTLKNSPIVYRVILNPNSLNPLEIHLDTNEIHSTQTGDGDLEKIKENSKRIIKLKK
ncbi:hypothetical protein [Xylocopilactobacillus apis]|uniref:Membrane protein n=1 Tax=Xylocopilactobacillus apis TaxID=2932183 RepID=A0AAU9DIS8_9LACO|nr:hypothetical protein [Xylocopilactobacillus apis]BDR56712.1 membrane protein [Xylocopilactobacillus apis]